MREAGVGGGWRGVAEEADCDGGGWWEAADGFGADGVPGSASDGPAPNGGAGGSGEAGKSGEKTG